MVQQLFGDCLTLWVPKTMGCIKFHYSTCQNLGDFGVLLFSEPPYMRNCMNTQTYWNSSSFSFSWFMTTTIIIMTNINNNEREQQNWTPSSCLQRLWPWWETQSSLLLRTHLLHLWPWPCWRCPLGWCPPAVFRCDNGKYPQIIYKWQILHGQVWLPVFTLDRALPCISFFFASTTAEHLVSRGAFPSCDWFNLTGQIHWNLI